MAKRKKKRGQVGSLEGVMISFLLIVVVGAVVYKIIGTMQDQETIQNADNPVWAGLDKGNDIMDLIMDNLELIALILVVVVIIAYLMLIRRSQGGGSA